MKYKRIGSIIFKDMKRGINFMALLFLKDRYIRYLNIAKLFLGIIISSVCLAAAVFFIIQGSETTYYYTYLSASFPTGELISSTVLLVLLFVMGVIASSPFINEFLAKILCTVDATVKLITAVYFTVFLHNIVYVRISIVVTAVYFALTVFSCIASPQDAENKEDG